MSEFKTESESSSSAQESSGGGWWSSLSSLASSAQHYAEDLEKSLLEQAKAAQSQMDAEAEKIRKEQPTATRDTPHLGAGLLLLPWETADEQLSILSDPLMEKIFALSIAEGNFVTTPPQEEFAAIHFDMTKSVPVILKILEIDKNLARMHAKLSPKMDEEVFWKNYFLRVKYLRAAIGIDGPDWQLSLGRLPEADVVHTVALHTTAPVRKPQQTSDISGKASAAAVPPVTSTGTDDGVDDEDASENEKELEEERAKLADAERRKAEAARLEAEVLAELNEDLDDDSGSPGGAGSSPEIVNATASAINDISLDEDDDAALEAMIAKELGEDDGNMLDDIDDEDLLNEFGDDDEELDFS